jgi:hypothetical protein
LQFQELFKPSSFFGGSSPKISPNAVQFAAMVIVQLLVHAPNPLHNLTGELGLGIAKFWISGIMLQFFLVFCCKFSFFL